MISSVTAGVSPYGPSTQESPYTAASATTTTPGQAATPAIAGQSPLPGAVAQSPSTVAGIPAQSTAPGASTVGTATATGATGIGTGTTALPGIQSTPSLPGLPGSTLPASGSAAGSATAATAPAAAGASSTGATSSSSQDVTGTDTFLKLLVAQLKNQDPMSPMDDQSFVTELAQFNTVEQMLGVKQSIDNEVGAQQAGEGVAMLGKTITYTVPGIAGNAATTSQGVVSGISLAGGTVQLQVGTTNVPLSQVTAVAS